MGILTLTVGGIGVSNIMNVVVEERTREIGIKMALGAKSRTVLGQFLLETFVFTAIGGIIGLALTWGFCAAVAGSPARGRHRHPGAVAADRAAHRGRARSGRFPRRLLSGPRRLAPRPRRRDEAVMGEVMRYHGCGCHPERPNRVRESKDLPRFGMTLESGGVCRFLWGSLDSVVGLPRSG